MKKIRILPSPVLVFLLSAAFGISLYFTIIGYDNGTYSADPRLLLILSANMLLWEITVIEIEYDQICIRYCLFIKRTIYRGSISYIKLLEEKNSCFLWILLYPLTIENLPKKIFLLKCKGKITKLRVPQKQREEIAVYIATFQKT